MFRKSVGGSYPSTKSVLFFLVIRYLSSNPLFFVFQSVLFLLKIRYRYPLSLFFSPLAQPGPQPHGPFVSFAQALQVGP